MLQQFTWQQFLVATLVLTLIWYAGVILIFYRKELIAFLIGKKTTTQSSEPLPHRWEKGVETLGEENEEELMGKPKMPEGMDNVGMSGFSFAQDEDAKEQQIGLVPDVLEELKRIFSILAKEDGNKKDFINLMEMVRHKYPKIASHPNIWHINEFISQHASFHLSKDELENLWD